MNLESNRSTQGCQIFLDTINQHGGKYTKLLLNYLIAIKCTKWV
jgi:hypothetical protein